MQLFRNRIDLILKATIASLTIALCVVVAGSLEPRIVQKGDAAPKFSLTTDQGRTVTRSDFGGKLLVLNFWATWCPPCIEELPSLDQFARRYASQGVTVLAVSVDASEQRYRELLDRVRPAFLTVRDPEASISSSYGTFKYPETYIIDSSGKVLHKEMGGRDWMDPAFLNYFQSLL